MWFFTTIGTLFSNTEVPHEISFIAMLLVFIAQSTNADPVQYFGELELSHSGGTDKCGCHYNKKTGEYHCHTRNAVVVVHLSYIRQ